MIRAILPAVFLVTTLPLGAGQLARAARPAPMEDRWTAAAPLPAYADLVDLVLAAPVILDGTIRSAARIKGAEAAGLAPGFQRFYVEVDVAALVRGKAGLPPRVGYVVDVADDARGRSPRLRKMRVLVFARMVPRSADQLQLVAPGAQIGWSPALDARVREIVRAALAADSPPAITGIASAFHVAGSLPGEGETQVFAQTADRRPVSLSILRRPGEAPRWSVAMGEIVDEAAAPPAPDTLLWYRLACGLPAMLPAASVATLSPEDADVARADYRFVIDSLGPCGRSRAAEPVSGGAAPA